MGTINNRRFKRIRQYVIQRDGLFCCYCNQQLTQDNATMEHIVPKSKGGVFNTSNLTVSCANCNNNRGNKPFFDYLSKFNLPKSKISKYKKLYFNNLKIKVLNIAKQQSNNSDYIVPINLISSVCHALKINYIDYSIYQSDIMIDFAELCETRQLRSVFEKIIKIIETDI